MAATADLAGEDAPALFTVGKDGAVFYWMYDPAPPNTRTTPQGYAQVPGKHRKRKAPDTDPIQPKAAAAGGDRAAVVDGGVGEAVVGVEEFNSSSDDSGSEESSGGSEGGKGAEAGQGPAAGALAEAAEDDADGTEVLASTTGRATEDQDQEQQQQQTLSFAGE